jgi:hypothetical protein
MKWDRWMIRIICTMILSESELHSSLTSLSCLKPSGSSSMTKSRQPETELSAVDDQDILHVLLCSLRSTVFCWVSSFCLLTSWSFLHESSLHMLGKQTQTHHGFKTSQLPSAWFSQQVKAIFCFLGCGCCVCQSFLEPQVRDEYQVGTKDG